MSAAKRSPAAPVPGAVTSEEALHFAAVAREIMSQPLTETQGQAGIGTLREKRLHLVLKTYICPDVSCHERRLSPGNRRDGMVADVLTEGGRIYEIQTGGFYPLKKKIAWYLENTDCPVTVVHPLPAVKYLSWISPTDGQILGRRKSPRRGKVTDVAPQLYWLSDFVGNPRFSLCLLFLDMEEYRFQDGWGRDGKRGSNRYERFPTALRGRVELTTPAQYAACFLPPSLPATPFTAAQYATATGIRGRATYGVLHLLVRLGVLQQAEKAGRSQCFLRASAGELSETAPAPIGPE